MSVQTANEVSSDAKQLASGGAVLAIAMIVANAGNYLLNVVLGRWLTPAEFADANLLVTLMLLVTAIAISLQMIAARYVGIYSVHDDLEATNALAAWLEKRAWVVGGVLAIALTAGAWWLSDVFRSESPWPFVILGLGMPFYLAQAVGRGVLQGQLEFRPLAATFVVEMLVRLGTGIVLVSLGLGVVGATIGLSVSFVATWLHVRLLAGGFNGVSIEAAAVREVIIYAGPIGLLLLGQIIVNNGDVLISKRYLEAETAGVYAAIALVGRAVFFLSWSVATTLFPAAAQRNERGEDSNSLLYGGLVAEALMGVGFVAGAAFLGGPVMGRVFGAEYAEVSGPLAWYAFATVFFAMANLIASHHLSMGSRREAVVLLIGGIVQTGALFANRGSIDSLISAQVFVMVGLFAAVLTSHLIRGGSHERIAS